MLYIDNLVVVYPDGTKAIDDISFTVENGENIALIGGNGAGKTTLMHTLMGLIKAQSGKIEVCGHEMSKKNLGKIRENLGFVFQNPDEQLFMPTIGADVAFGPKNMGISGDELENCVTEALRTMGILHMRNRSPMRMSGGEKRSAAIASVIAMNPKVLLLDEPSAFLDPKSRRRLINTLNSLPQSKVITTHDMHFANETCQKIIIMKHGKIFAQGGRELLFDKELMDEAELEALNSMYMYC